MKAVNTEPDERALIEAAQQDTSRFAELYEAHFNRVYAFIVRRVRDRTEAEDLTADVFHQALAGIGRFEWRGAPFATWLFRIAANAIADRGRRVARERPLEGNESNEVPRGDSRRADPVENFAETERQAALFALVESLPADQRRVIIMRFGEEKALREIAIALGRSEGAVKQLQFRALKNLKSRMEGAHG